VLDHLHRCLTTWLAPVLCFTAEEAWCARFGEQESVHLQLFPELPAAWRDDELAERWERIREVRRRITVPLEEARRAGLIGSSLQAAVTLPLSVENETLLSAEEWAEIAIVSSVQTELDAGEPAASIRLAEGSKCARCWRVLPEVGRDSRHPTLCARCTDAVESGLVCRAAAA
jgi:isoleucyl-tRNA synthetase